MQVLAWEIRVASAESRSRHLDLRQDVRDRRQKLMVALGTIIDAIADLRAEYQQHDGSRGHGGDGDLPLVNARHAAITDLLVLLDRMAAGPPDAI